MFGEMRKRRLPKCFLVTMDMKIKHLDGSVWVRKGSICLEQDNNGTNQGEFLCVKVLDNRVTLKLEKKYLLEVTSDLGGLLEPVDPDQRLKLIENPALLTQLATLPDGAPLWVTIGPDEIVEAQLRYIGPVSSSSSAVYFGVQLKDELNCRVDFLLEHCFRLEREEMETMENVNKLLLQNVLPLHVASVFMGKDVRNQDLYSQSYDCVCVMFASVPQFKEFYNESSINKDGLECLRFLNEIISDFDELLSKPKFSSVEKIKTIGSTYMAAAGLTPPGEERKDKCELSYSHVRAMVEFAIALMGKLEAINRHSFQSFKLRIGINHGPVIAGVIGAHKPQYDIWGNTVNVASRMDSTGVLDKIQVTDETQQMVESIGYSCTLRGVVNVKGKGELTTYFINTDHSGTI